MTDTPEFFYRFRSVESLIGPRQELANQEIFFASPKNLNDPMEGFKDIFWQGDAIVWRNFFRNYLFCLERLCMLLILVGEQEPLNAEMIPTMSNEDQLPTEEAKNLSKEIWHEFSNNETISKFIDRLVRRSKPIRRNELHSHISNVHLLAVETIFRIFEAKGLKPSSATNTPINELESKLAEVIKSIDLLEQAEAKYPNIAAEQLYETLRHTTTQLNLIGKASLASLSEFKNRNFILRDFPEEYLNKIEELLYPEWYVACFMSDCSNASVWGHYGNNHSGVCLKFKSSLANERPSITLHGVNGLSSRGPTLGPLTHEFHKVNYISNFAEVNFFRSLGRFSAPILNKFWFTNDKGERSVCANEILSSSNEAWRNSYWSKFHQGMTTKSQDWDYEKEYRLILSGNLIDFSEPKDRKLKYNFNDLDGIIFGIKTSTEHKLEIIEIIGKKCQTENRKDFNFYQAFFSHEKGCIVSFPLGLIKFHETIQ